MTAANATLSVPEQLAQLQRWMKMLLAPDQVVELRGLHVVRGARTATYSGYYDTKHLDQFAHAALTTTHHAAGIYFTLNPLQPAVLARRSYRLAYANRGELSTDHDVLCRRWLLLDIDPVRPSGISATDTEKQAAHQLTLTIKDHLASLQWPSPILADSGNGYHLLYRVDLPVDDRGLLKNVLRVLADRFDTAQVKVDRVVANPARLCKVPGTYARKGEPQAERPHRLAVLLAGPTIDDPSQGQPIVPPPLLEQLVAEASRRPTPMRPPAAPANSRRPTGQRLCVERWLTDHRIEYRVKEAVDSLGRTTYVLACCPFDSQHRDPDACIMQGEDGRMAAKCFHNSCAGRGWQEFKKAIGAPRREHYESPLDFGTTRPTTTNVGEPPPDIPQGMATDSSPAGLPEIVANERQLREIADEAWQAVVLANQPPQWFLYAGAVARFVPAVTDESPKIEIFNGPAFRGVLTRTANWYETRHLRECDISVPCFPPKAVVDDLLKWPVYPHLPVLDGITSCPYFLADGTLVQQAGYHPRSRLWYAPNSQFQLLPVPDHPSAQDIAEAKRWLLEELLGDFPFADDASRAHVLAALFLPFVRAIIQGPTPLHLMDAPTEGTGKSLLVKVLCIIALGYECAPLNQPNTDEEFRKRITATLIEGPPIILIDNINLPLDSASLASVLTDTRYKDRILGVSRTLEMRNRAVWFGTGNNVVLSREIGRRVVGCRLNAHTEMPSTRTGFRHSPLVAWVYEHRSQLVHAILTLGRAWFAAGRPKGQATLGMFEHWAEVIGGILDCIGIPGLLANRREYASRRSQSSDWLAFVTCWWSRYEAKPVGVAALYQLAVEEELLEGEMGDGNEQSRRTKLGIELRRRVDRIYGAYQINGIDDDHRGRQQFRLRAMPDPKADPVVPAAPNAPCTPDDVLHNLRH